MQPKVLELACEIEVKRERQDFADLSESFAGSISSNQLVPYEERNAPRGNPGHRLSIAARAL